MTLVALTCVPGCAGIEEQEEADPRGPAALNMAAVSLTTWRENHDSLQSHEFIILFIRFRWHPLFFPLLFLLLLLLLLVSGIQIRDQGKASTNHKQTLFSSNGRSHNHRRFWCWGGEVLVWDPGPFPINHLPWDFFSGSLLQSVPSFLTKHFTTYQSLLRAGQSKAHPPKNRRRLAAVSLDHSVENLELRSVVHSFLLST